MKQTSYVGCNLKYKGDSFIFWELLKAMKAKAESDKIEIEFGQVTTIEEE
jgi:hypothetical protein